MLYVITIVDLLDKNEKTHDIIPWKKLGNRRVCKVKKIISKIDVIIEKMLIGILLVMCIALALQVLFRYVFNSPLIWSEELARYLFVWITFLGAGYGVKHHLHVEMSIFFNKFPLKIKKLTQVVTNIAVIGSFLYILPSSIEFMKIQHPIMATTLNIPLSLLFAAAPVGSILLIFFLVIDTITIFSDPNHFDMVTPIEMLE